MLCHKHMSVDHHTSFLYHLPSKISYIFSSLYSLVLALVSYFGLFPFAIVLLCRTFFFVFVYLRYEYKIVSYFSLADL